MKLPVETSAEPGEAEPVILLLKLKLMKRTLEE